MDLKLLQTFGEALFLVHTEDLNRLVRWIRRTAAAQDLTSMVRRFVRGRLQYGPVQRGNRVTGPVRGERVRFWDPAKAWHTGDLAIFPEPEVRDRIRVFTPRTGQIIRIQGGGVTVRIDGRQGTHVYGTTSTQQGGEALKRWRRSVEDLVRVLPDRSDEPSLIDFALYRFGERVATDLLNALRQDGRFLAMEGQWFLRSLAVRSDRPQLVGLAQAMLMAVDRPVTAAELLPLVPPPVTGGAAGLFGLALSLQEHPDLFTNVDAGARPRWVLSGAPPGEYTARLAAFDPETWAVLCEPGDALNAATVQRLWSLGLLPVVLAR